jgi:hypothetical protein
MKRMTYVSLRLGRWLDHFCKAWEKLPWLCWRRRRWRGAHFDVPSGAWGTTCRWGLPSLTLSASSFDSGLLDTGHGCCQDGAFNQFHGPIGYIYMPPEISFDIPIKSDWYDLARFVIWRHLKEYSIRSIHLHHRSTPRYLNVTRSGSE